MRVLIAGHSLGVVGGVEAYERDLATWLLARGHAPVVYSTHLGETAEQMLRLTVPVTDDLRTIAAPIDVIHGDNPVEAMAALLHFPDTPAVFVCHGWGDALSTTPTFPRILRYVAVDDTCADRLLVRDGIPQEKISVLLNAVDVTKFRQRARLPARPTRAVVFDNQAHELTSLPVIRDACRRASIEVDVVGGFAGTAVTDPQSVLGAYDIAFAKGKCAMEAMACGLAVILSHSRGVGGLVRSGEFDRLRRLNFGLRSLEKPLAVETLLSELALYDCDDARAVSDRIRETASADALHESLLATYEAVIAEHARAGTNGQWQAESRAASAFLHRIALTQTQKQHRVWPLINAAQRVLQVPVVGPLARRAGRWLIRQR